MPSKFCRKCGRVTSASFIPNFCAWGCGSLESEPLLPDYDKWDERLKMIEELKQNRAPEPELITEEIKPGAFQVKLF
jgi:hypothetical protein